MMYLSIFSSSIEDLRPFRCIFSLHFLIRVSVSLSSSSSSSSSLEELSSSSLSQSFGFPFILLLFNCNSLFVCFVCAAADVHCLSFPFSNFLNLLFSSNFFLLASRLFRNAKSGSSSSFVSTSKLFFRLSSSSSSSFRCCFFFFIFFFARC